MGLGSPPQLFEACRVARRVLDGVLNVAVSEVILNEPRIRALVPYGGLAVNGDIVYQGQEVSDDVYPYAIPTSNPDIVISQFALNNLGRRHWNTVWR